MQTIRVTQGYYKVRAGDSIFAIVERKKREWWLRKDAHHLFAPMTFKTLRDAKSWLMENNNY